MALWKQAQPYKARVQWHLLVCMDGCQYYPSGWTPFLDVLCHGNSSHLVGPSIKCENPSPREYIDLELKPIYFWKPTLQVAGSENI